MLHSTHINIGSIVVLERRRRRRRAAGSATAAASRENIVKSAAHFRTVKIRFPPPETSCYVRIMFFSNFISFASDPDGSWFGESGVSGWACGSISMPVNNYPNFVDDFVAIDCRCSQYSDEIRRCFFSIPFISHMVHLHPMQSHIEALCCELRPPSERNTRTEQRYVYFDERSTNRRE